MTDRRDATAAPYDVVIVGGGSAGCALAARLSEDSRRRVLLIEAGPDYASERDLPADVANAACPTTGHDWGFRSEPDARGRSIDLPRAKLMGGCSSTNATIALRGAPSDYDEWAARGNQSWSFAEVLPYFRRLESDLDFDDEWHGSDGPLPIRRARRDEMNPFHQATIDAALAVGHAWVDDHNHPDALGVGPLPLTAVDGLRMSTALAYLASARGRTNLTIQPRTVADRVVVRRGRVAGVRFAGPAGGVDAGQVVLAAGAYASPAILMRSGIGRATDLVALDIDVVADLPGVGRNLMDHPALSVDVSAVAAYDGPWFEAIVTWRSTRAGPRAGCDMHLVPGGPIRVDPSASPTGAVGFLFVGLMRPNSRGSVALRSADPTAAPRVTLGHLDDPDDLARMIEGVRAARRMFSLPRVADLVAGPELWPGAHVPDDDEALAAAILERIGVYHHASGTCSMGPEPDRGAVVDATGRVHGIEGLFVADASLMPEIPDANTNLPAIMIAERVAATLADSAG